MNIIKSLSTQSTLLLPISQKYKNKLLLVYLTNYFEKNWCIKYNSKRFGKLEYVFMIFFKRWSNMDLSQVPFLNKTKFEGKTKYSDESKKKLFAQL